MIISAFIQPNLNVNGGLMSVASNTTLSVAPTQIRDYTNSNDIIVEDTTTINFGNNGVNALDTGDIAASKAYYIYAISSSAQMKVPAYVASLSATPYMPFDYDTYRRLGVVFSNSSSQLIPFLEAGNANDKHYQYYAANQVLNAQAATTWTNVDLSAFVPSFAQRVYLQYSFTPNAATDTAQITAPGGTNAALVTIKGSTAGVAIQGTFSILCNLATISSVIKPAIAYQLSTGTSALSLSVIGFDDYL